MENVLTITDSCGDKLKVEPNYNDFDQNSSWEHSKGMDEPFYIEIYESDSSEDLCVGLSLEQVTKLRDFLTEKINYLAQK